MIRLGLILGVLALSAGNLQAELQVRDIEASYGPLGPVRETLEYHEFDAIFFRYSVAGAEIDDEGKVQLATRIVFTDSDGNDLFDNEHDIEGVVAFGGGVFPGSSWVRLDATVEPGEYTFKVMLTDRLASESVSFERNVTIKPPEFAIVSAGFFYDDEGRVAAPAGGYVGQQWYFGVRLIGFDKSQGKIDASFSAHVLDENGRELLPQPISAQVEVDDPDVVREAPFLNFFGEFALTRPGNFRLRITAEDHIGNQQTEFEVPMTIRKP